MKKKSFIILFTLTSFSTSFVQTNHKMRYEHKIRIRQAISASTKLGEKNCNEINGIPFMILHLIGGIESLIIHPYLSADFMLSENDPVLKTNIFYKKSSFQHFYYHISCYLCC